MELLEQLHHLVKVMQVVPQLVEFQHLGVQQVAVVQVQLVQALQAQLLAVMAVLV
jgi:hypothetical protein